MENADLINQIADMLEAQTTRIELKIENEISKKIEALFDGYKLTSEKQSALEARVDNLERNVGGLSSRVSSLGY